MERSDTVEVKDEDIKPAWGKLTSITLRQSNIDLIENEYTFGRANTNTVPITDKRLSSTHCKVVKEEDGKAYIVDLSTNGTFHDNDKIGKGEKRELNSGDKLYLLHHSKVPAEDVLGYIFSFKGDDSSALKKQREEDAKALEEQKRITEKQTKLVDELGEEMRCCICIDYIYGCVTLVPCLHNFCGACFSDWMKKSKICPSCREEVTEVKKNPTINNIIEKFLEAHPEKKRAKEEYEEMDKLNKITLDRFSLKENKVVKKKPSRMEEEDDDDEYDEDEDEDEYDEDEEEEEEEEVKCQECERARMGDGYKCNATNPVHVYCTACYKPFPDRKSQFPQQCVICNQHFCNLYFTCRNSGLGNRLELLEKHNVRPILSQDIFRGNRYEVKVLTDYMATAKITAIDLYQEFLRDWVDKGKFKYKIDRSIIHNNTRPSTEIPMERKTPVCVTCFDRYVWFQILFRYRESIKAKLPPMVRDRPECWYGINCRTMIHKEDHARKLNHICEQNKF